MAIVYDLLLKVTGAWNHVCVNCIVWPVGGDKWLLKYVFVIESFIQQIRSKTLNHTAMKQKYVWVSHWISHFLFILIVNILYFTY